MEDYKKKFEEIMNKIDDQLDAVPYATLLSEKIGIRKCYIALVVTLNIALSIVFALGVNVLGNLVVFIYPVYASFKAIQSDNKDDDTQWLTYWVVYALLSVIESVSIVASHIPYFGMIRVIFLVLCWHPNVQLSKVIYDKVIYPYILMDKKTE